MKSLASLAREHEAIGRLLDRLEAEIDELARNGGIDVEAVERLLTFFEERVDGQHQEKEERVFLPRLATRALGADATLVRTALEDHAAERAMLALMRSNVLSASYGEPNSTSVVVRFARRYVRHQREHSRWEQLVLFPLARRVLSPRDDHAVLAGFRGMDATRGSVVDAARRLEEWLDQRRSVVTV